MSSYRATVEPLFKAAGIGFDGQAPHDLVIHDQRFFQRFLRDGTLGLGESYVDGWWDCERVDEMMSKLAGAKLKKQFALNRTVVLQTLKAKLFNEGRRDRAKQAISYHYDIGNDLYELMLDERMVYTCAYWAHATDLATAQRHKMELVCKKLQLKPGMKVLDIGCGFGSFAKYAAQNHGVEVTGITISKEQLAYAEQSCKGLPVKFQLVDYRDVQGTFDRVLSIGMFEHVTYKNHRKYFETVERVLADDGLTLVHTMGRFDSVVRPNDQFITRYVFPNTQVPSVAQIGEAIDSLLTIEDWESFGPYYDRTLMAWLENFDATWPKLQGKYDERFRRLWRYYLQIFAGWFRARLLQLWQIVMSKTGIPGGYQYQALRTSKELLG